MANTFICVINLILHSHFPALTKDNQWRIDSVPAEENHFASHYLLFVMVVATQVDCISFLIEHNGFVNWV